MPCMQVHFLCRLPFPAAAHQYDVCAGLDAQTAAWADISPTRASDHPLRRSRCARFLGEEPSELSTVNFDTSFCSCAAIWPSSCAAFCVSAAPVVVLAAALATPPMFLVISPEPLAASETLRLISFVVAVCSSTAVAIVCEISLIWLMMLVISPIACTLRWVSD